MSAQSGAHSGAQRATLIQELESAARDGGRGVRRARIRAALGRVLERDLLLLPLIPALALFVQLMLWIGGGPGSESVTMVALLSAVGLAAFVLVRWGIAASSRISRRSALYVVDRELGLADRLQTADEFLELQARTPFMEAALLDAQAALAKVGDVHFTLPGRDAQPRRGVAGAVVAAVLLTALAAWIGGLPRDLTRSGGATLDVARVDGVAVVLDEVHEDTTDALAPPRVEPPEVASIRDPKQGGKTTESRSSSPDVSAEAKPSEGETGAGRSAEAMSARGASQSRGLASKQAQTTKVSAVKPKPGKPGARKDAKKPEEQAKKRNEEESGSTAGRGSSKGSNRNPAVSNWSSKDQVTTEDDQEVEDDDETEDEAEEQDARGGVQPSMRDRRPPVSRDLRIGFGNNKNPDANGRGGPSTQKKSRGTASLVLGVPIPDRIKGQPGRGKTKITQERIEPEAEDFEVLSAGARAPRSSPVGHVARPDLAPWMRALVRAYFLTLRKTNL
jgi:hypothetical protein